MGATHHVKVYFLDHTCNGTEPGGLLKADCAFTPNERQEWIIAYKDYDFCVVFLPANHF